MKRMNLTTTTSPKLTAVALVAIAFCLCVWIAAPFAGSSLAFGEPEDPEGVSTQAETVDTFRGWYLSGTTAKIDGTGGYVSTYGGSGGYDTSGNLVTFSVLESSSNCTYVSSATYTYLLSASLDLSSSQPTNYPVGTTPWQLFERTEVTKPVEPEPTTIEKPDVTVPGTGGIPTQPDPTAPTTQPEEPQKPTVLAPPEPTEPTAPSPQLAVPVEQEATTADNAIYALLCRQSEVEAKTAELETRGYEVVHVQRAPEWWPVH